MEENPIKALCDSLPRGVSELAEGLDVTRQTVCLWVRGEKAPGPQNRKILAEKYGLDVRSLRTYFKEQTQEGSEMELVREMMTVIREMVDRVSNSITGRMATLETSTNSRLENIERTMADRFKSMEDRMQGLVGSNLAIENASSQRFEKTSERIELMERRLAAWFESYIKGEQSAPNLNGPVGKDPQSPTKDQRSA